MKHYYKINISAMKRDILNEVSRKWLEAVLRRSWALKIDVSSKCVGDDSKKKGMACVHT